jgi:predicted hotdog family 3-hydroxylacyl-ACP dehydratase
VHLDRYWIEAHIPHKGGMCLLDEVLSWDATRIRCRSASHRALDNPLRAHDRLGAACGIEYAAQAMAVHGALIGAAAGPAASGTGYLASVRNIAFFVSRLDDLQTDLVAEAERVHGDARTVLYDFSVSTAGRMLLKGRATIVLELAAARSNPRRIPA